MSSVVGSFVGVASLIRVAVRVANTALSLGANVRCVLQWELSGACAGEVGGGGLKDAAEAVVEDESDGYVLDLRDGSDLDRGSDFEGAAEERRSTPVSVVSRKDVGTRRGCKRQPKKKKCAVFAAEQSPNYLTTFAASASLTGRRKEREAQARRRGGD